MHWAELRTGYRQSIIPPSELECWFKRESSRSWPRPWSARSIPYAPKKARLCGISARTPPWVSFAPNGDLYAISLSFGFFSPQNAIYVSKSAAPSGGASWGAPIAIAEDNTGGLDKQSITADPFDSNYVYAAWDRFVSPPGIIRWPIE